MRSNILLIGAAIAVISFIITLNLFFQQNYQTEMAGQFGKQQLLLAENISKNIGESIGHMKGMMAVLAGLSSGTDFKAASAMVVREGLDTDLNVLDGKGGLRDGETLVETEGGRLRLTTPLKASKGALVLSTSIDSLNRKFVAPIKSGAKGYAWLMDGNGTLIYHPTQPEMQGKNLFKADASCLRCHKSFETEKKILESGATGVQTYIAPFGEDKIIAFSRINLSRDSFWIACVSAPYSEVTAGMRKSMRLHSILVLAIFATTTAGAFTVVAINRRRIKAEEKARHEAYFEKYAKELEEEVNRRTLELAHSEKLASIGRLTAGIAHEIGNPLTAVFSFLQILREKETDDFKKESLDTVLLHINRIADTVRQLSGLAKVPPAETKETELNGVIESALGLLQFDKRAKGIKIIKELSPLPPVVTDANRLSQVFVNLILNAVDAMHGGGALTVRSRPSGDRIEVEFEDTGVGIERENLQRVFDPFFTTKDKGTGLGLSVSYSIVKRLGGDITVESEPGKGTRFTIKIPKQA